ncbi:MAG TPA: fumarylacetoacetate hydrolase family protein [Phnomibacter sp.]|nr:fumarylacetoacetate hydrolase family protein [Phnomibacter sp.]
MIKLYNTTNGPVAERDGTYYPIDMAWEGIFKENDLFGLLRRGIDAATTSSKALQGTVEMPMLPSQELWACGVTYIRSRDGRQEESKDAGGGDFYARVYEADRPEVFHKASYHRTVGHGRQVRIRRDSTWNVPEPELTLVVDPAGKIIGYTIGNDMSSRSIEGENPLYLPQAKTYDGCASLGPCILVTSNGQVPSGTIIRMRIERNGLTVFKGEVSLAQMRRSLEELVSYVYLECSFPAGCFIMTGTGIVPPADFTLHHGDTIHISIEGIGTLTNTVADT